MTINIILPVLANSGGADVIYKYSEMMTKKGHDVIIYKPLWSFDYKRYPWYLVNKIHQLYCTAKNLTRVFHKEHSIDKYIFTASDAFIRDADVIIATSWPTSFCVNKLSLKKGKKFYFVQGFEIWDNEEYGLKSYMLPLNKIVISAWINNKLKERLKIGPFPVVYNGIDTEKFSNSNKIYKKNGEQIRCLMLNHTLKKKGVEDGVRAFERAKEYCPNMVLESFGLCEKGNLPDYVKYTRNPSKTELVEMYNRSDIFIFPSREEGWGLTPLEAMACQCAVVGTNTGFVIDFGEHGINMMISDPGDINGLANNIVRLAEDRELLEKISERGKMLAQGLSWDKSCNDLENILCGR